MTPASMAGIDQLLHRAAADAGGVEDEAFELVAQVGRDLLHAGVVTPNMVMPIAGSRPARRAGLLARARRDAP